MEGCESEMSVKEYVLSPQALVMVQGSSKGTQPKYYEKGFWYKVNNLGYEGYSEYLVSKVLECSNVDSYVKYEQCTINGRAGCRSKSFIREYRVGLLNVFITNTGSGYAYFKYRQAF